MHPGDRPPGFLATLRAAANAGALAGLVWGLLDGVYAWTGVGLRGGALAGLLCLIASVLVYGIVHSALLLASSPLWHALLRKRSLGVRCRALFGVGLGWGLAAEVYWHSRPYLYFGYYSAKSPERLAFGAACLLGGLAAGWWLARLWARTPRWWRLSTEIAAILCWLVGGSYLWLERGAFERSGRGELNERNRELPNVLFVVVDALRQDVLGCYGNEDVRTPSIDRLAQEGARFANAFAQAPFTTTSFGSWLTGKYPRRHGLLKLSADAALPSNVTIAWHLKQAAFRDGSGGLEEQDYVAAAFMTGAVTHSSGLDRGFDVYSEALRGHSLVELDSAWSTFRSELLLLKLWSKLRQRVDYNQAASTAVEWLEEHADRRFFAWVHLYSTHTPYAPAEEFRELYVDPAYEGPLENGFWAEHRIAIERGDYEPRPEDVQQIKNLYFGGVTQADAAIGELVDVLRRRGVLDDTVVIVTADHGEDLGDGGRFEHNHMYETNLRVPLVVRHPRSIPAGTVVEPLVDSIDLLPSVCELLGLSLPPDDPEDPTDDVDGASFLPLVRGEDERLRAHTIAENGPYVSASDGRHKLVLRRGDLEAGGWEALERELTVRAAGAAHEHVGELPLLRFQPPRHFDLSLDPAEERNLFDPARPEVLALRQVLLDYAERMPIRSADVVLSGRDLEEAENLLDGLGYTGGGIGLGAGDE